METLLAALALLLVAISACAAGALLVYGGVWGVLRIVRADVANLAQRLDTQERLSARRLGQLGVERKDQKRAAEDKELAALEAAVSGRSQRPRLVSPDQLPDLGEGNAHQAFSKVDDR